MFAEGVAIRRLIAAAPLAIVWLIGGCYAPMHSPGILARDLPMEYRLPIRTSGQPLNYSMLVASQPPAYVLGAGDVLDLTIPDLIQRGDARPFRVQVMDSGEIQVPRIGPVMVGGKTPAEAQAILNETLAAGLLVNPSASMTLVERGQVNVLVLGSVQRPGIHSLPRTESDVAHALAAAGGFGAEAGEVIEIHRKFQGDPNQFAKQTGHPKNQVSPIASTVSLTNPTRERGASTSQPPATIATLSHRVPSGQPSVRTNWREGPFQKSVSPRPRIRGQSPDLMAQYLAPPTSHLAPTASVCACEPIVRIPLRGTWQPEHPTDVMLFPGDVIVVPPKMDQVFYVVGPLSNNQNRPRFVGDRALEIGNGLLLPPDREIDVVTAVAMAGYIDPIESPTTVTVHRVAPDGRPMLVLVDLIAAREDPAETILVQPGDIIYLNPDAPWYMRRLIDRTLPNVLSTSIGRWLSPTNRQ